MISVEYDGQWYSLPTTATSVTTTATDNWEVMTYKPNYPLSISKPVTEAERIIKDIVKDSDYYEKVIEDEVKLQEEKELKKRQEENKFYRSLVKDVKFSGDRCIVFWKDGTKTMSKWNPFDSFDPEKAILVCMARKLYNDNNVFLEVLDKYSDKGWDVYYSMSEEELKAMYYESEK